jgi:general secretion pathway protein L
MLTELLTWWVERMRELSPARLRARDDRPADALVVEASATTTDLRLFQRRRRRETALGSIEAGAPRVRPRSTGPGRAVALRLAPSDVLEREVTLPLAAERDLDGVLRYEMDRLTPFAAADVLWTAVVLRRDRVRDRLGVRLVLVPRAGLRPALAALTAAGTPATVLEIPGGPDRAGSSRTGWTVIALDGTGQTAWRRRGATALAAACAVLAVAVVAVPPLRQSLALDGVEQRIAALRPRVEEAAAIRRRIAAARANVDVVAAQRARVGDPLAALATLTEILPDDTYLTELTLAQRRVMLRGQAAGAARLIALLAADPGIRDPAFAAPVVRNEAGRADLFSIQAEIAP